MRADAGGTPPRHLSAVPVQRKDAAPGSSRPDPDGTGSSGAGGKPPAKRRTRYTARAAILLLVFSALVLALAYPLQQYVSQSSQLDRIRKQNTARTAEVERLKEQLSAWQDSAFVEIQARKRLHYVKPGETGLRLLGPTDASGASPDATASGTPGTAWYSQLWNSVTSANSPTPTSSSGTSSSPGPGSSGR